MDDIQDQQAQQVVKIYENTYRIGPSEGKKFSDSRVRSAVSDLLERKFSKNDPATESRREYRANEAVLLSKEISREVLAYLKTTVPQYPNYKYVVQTVVGQVRGQGCRIASRCLWDKESDSSVSVTYQTSSMFITVMVFGCYYE